MADTLEGKTLPELELPVTGKKTLEIPKDLKGQWTVLYFYPKDDTPGCTKQACGYRDQLEDFTKMGVEVFGVSMDDLESHHNFQEKYHLNFPLIADTEHRLSEFLGVYGDQEWQGKTFKGLSRDTFLIDPEVKVCKVWRKVTPTETVKETLETVRSYM